MAEKKYILISSGKGGSGKTTIADELLDSLERSQIPVDFINLDTQPGARHKERELPEAEFAVVDTPGSVTDDLPEQMEAASIIVIPTRASVLDQPRLEMMRDLARRYAPSTPVVIVPIISRFRLSKGFLEWLNSSLTEQEHIATLPLTELATTCAAEGMSIIQYNRTSKLAAAVWRLVNTIRELLGISAEPVPLRRDGQPIAAYRNLPNY